MNGRMALEHAEIAFGAGDDDHVDLLRADELFGRDEFEVQHVFFLTPSPACGERVGGGAQYRGETCACGVPLPQPSPAERERELR